MAAEHIKCWTVGEVEIIRIVEMYDFQDDIWVLLKDATPDLMRGHDWLFPHYSTPDGRMRMISTSPTVQRLMCSAAIVPRSPSPPGACPDSLLTTGLYRPGPRRNPPKAPRP